MSKKYQNVDSAHEYAWAVVSGKTVACKWIRLACQRHLDDLERSWEYVYARDLAERACVFVQLMPHVKGQWARRRELIQLQAWQKFLICSIFGWVHAETRLRRFREAYCEIPRKNGKSVLAAAIGHVMFAIDGEYGAEVYCGATTERQAWEVFRPARLMALRTPEYCAALGIEVNAANISRPADGSRFEPLVGDPGDGSSPSCALIDEFHEHDSWNLYNTMDTGMGAREQPLIFIITTAGNDVSAPCYEKRGEVVRMLDGSVPREDLFGVIYTIDERDDWTDQAALRKANPNYPISISADYLIQKQANAKKNASRQNAFLTKHLNCWVNAKSAFINADSWQHCADTALKLDEFRGERAWVIADLASRLDVCALVLLIKKTVNKKNHYWVFGRYYLPESALERSKNRDAYERWKNQGHLIVTDGDEIDFDFIGEEIIEFSSGFELAEFVFDPWRATQLAQQIAKSGALTVEFRNTVANMSPAMKELEAAIESGRLHHDGSPILAWMASNVTNRQDKKGNYYPDKESQEKKIDGMVAIMMGIGRAMFDQHADGDSQFGIIGM